MVQFWRISVCKTGIQPVHEVFVIFRTMSQSMGYLSISCLTQSSVIFEQLERPHSGPCARAKTMEDIRDTSASSIYGTSICTSPLSLFVALHMPILLAVPMYLLLLGIRSVGLLLLLHCSEESGVDVCPWRWVPAGVRWHGGEGRLRLVGLSLRV